MQADIRKIHNNVARRRSHPCWPSSTSVLAGCITSLAICCFAVWYSGLKTQPLGIAWTKTPPKVAIVVPFTAADLPKVLGAVERWEERGKACPKLRSLAESPLHILLWFNRDLEDGVWSEFAKHARARVANALEPVAECFASVRFGSAQLTDAEDPYPFGPSNQWYKLYLSPTNPLVLYDYFLWAEFDLVPVRSGWMDALVEEVTFHEGFFMRGSIHRGSKLDIAVQEAHTAPWLTHINGNAIYVCNDKEFRAMVNSCYLDNASDRSKGFLASFDVAIWMAYVTSYMTRWNSYQNYAHKFQYTEFMQNYGENLSEEVLAWVLARSPSTYMIHGSSESAGSKHRDSEIAKRQHAGLMNKQKHTVTSDRLAVVVPLIQSQIQRMSVLFNIASQHEFRPCDTRTGIDLVLYLSQQWTSQLKREMQALLDASPVLLDCFREIVWAEASLSAETDVHTATVFTGPNMHFRHILENRTMHNSYDAAFVLEPDTTPIQAGWLEALRDLVQNNKEPFWIRGSAYKGFREDWIRDGFGSPSTSTWTAMNGNALYWLQDDRFFQFLERVWEKLPDAPYDIAIFSYLHDLANFRETKLALARIHYTDFIQNFGGTPYVVDKLKSEYPGTYLVHSSCRLEFPDRKLYCYVCDVDASWSESCRIKLRSNNVTLGFDRFITGPTYNLGIPLDNAHHSELVSAKVLI